MKKDQRLQLTVAAEPFAAARPRPMLFFRVIQLSEGRGG